MSEPVRIQRQRRRGWRMPPNTVYVGRPSKWGNPSRTGIYGVPDSRPTPADAVASFEAFLAGSHPDRAAQRALIRSELRGKNLACWCRLDQPCHADVLLRLANVDTEP